MLLLKEHCLSTCLPETVTKRNSNRLTLELDTLVEKSTGYFGLFCMAFLRSSLNILLYCKRGLCLLIQLSRVATEASAVARSLKLKHIDLGYRMGDHQPAPGKTGHCEPACSSVWTLICGLSSI